jgi:hypothetical protein
MVHFAWYHAFDIRTIRKPNFFVRISSLDRFIKKRVIKNILFMTKQSRLEVKKTLVRISTGKKMADHLKTGLFVRFSNGFNKMAAFYHSKTGHKKRPKNDFSNTRQSGIRWFTVKCPDMWHFIDRIPIDCGKFRNALKVYKGSTVNAWAPHKSGIPMVYFSWEPFTWKWDNSNTRHILLNWSCSIKFQKACINI